MKVDETEEESESGEGNDRGMQVTKLYLGS